MVDIKNGVWRDIFIALALMLSGAVGASVWAMNGDLRETRAKVDSGENADKDVIARLTRIEDLLIDHLGKK